METIDANIIISRLKAINNGIVEIVNIAETSPEKLTQAIENRLDLLLENRNAYKKMLFKLL